MARASTLNVSLTPKLRSYVESQIDAGGYESASEVVRDALRLMAERDKARESFWREVRQMADVAEAQMDRGEAVDGDSAMDELEAELAQQQPRARKRR